MTKYTTNSCDFDLVFSGPESVEEYNTAAGRENAVLEDAVNNIIWRSTLPQWQRAFAEALETRYPDSPRLIDEEATRKAKARAKDKSAVADVKEKATRYIARVVAEHPSDDLAQLAQQVADTITINPAPTVRTSSGVNKGWLAKAQDILGRDEEAREATIERLLSVVPGYELQRDEDGVPIETSLARLIGKFMDASL
jgi:hypothetical protein